MAKMQLKLFSDESREAMFSEDGSCRFSLSVNFKNTDQRIRKRLAVIGLNPSTATADKDDPTIKRVKLITRANGFNMFTMLNLFPYITSEPDELPGLLESDFNRVKQEANISVVRTIIANSENVLFAWGNFKQTENSDLRQWLLQEYASTALVIQLNKNGSPKHPLFCKGSTKLQKFSQCKS